MAQLKHINGFFVFLYVSTPFSYYYVILSYKFINYLQKFIQILLVGPTVTYLDKKKTI